MAVRREEEWRRSGPFPSVEREALVGVAGEMAAARPWIDAVFLFGSRARGRVHPGSDIDLAVLPLSSCVIEDRLSVEAAMARLAEERTGVPTDVVLVRRELSPSLLFEIFLVETILYARDRERAHEVACRARAEYRDLRPRLERSFEWTRRAIVERARALRSDECP